jgi:hypothetical protein
LRSDFKVGVRGKPIWVKNGAVVIAIMMAMAMGEGWNRKGELREFENLGGAT